LFTWRGAWGAANAYNTNDIVTSSGGTYRRKTNGTSGTAPQTDPTNWDPIALPGGVGPQGPQGAAGPQGPQGPTGPASVVLKGSVALTGNSQNYTANSYAIPTGQVSVDNAAPAAGQLSYSFTATAGKKYKISVSGAISMTAGTPPSIGGHQLIVPTNPGGTLRGGTAGNVQAVNTANSFAFSVFGVFYCSNSGPCVVALNYKNSPANGTLVVTADTILEVEEF
jgi:hypothetical protein